ncbi:MAG: FKBP-type peptidyl-prolyl cis-trans isomerase [Candidatus Krumholzibacteriia bacterium]
MRHRVTLIAMLALTCALAACGGEKDDDGAAAEPPATQSNASSQAIAKLTEGDGAGKQVVTTADGLHYLDLKVGDGPQPQPGQTCVTNATLWLLDGTRVWSSLDDGTPFGFVLGGGGVIRGWDEGVATMQAGGTRRLAVPPELGYGAKGRPPVPPNAWLIFTIDLLEVQGGGSAQP